MKFFNKILGAFLILMCIGFIALVYYLFRVLPIPIIALSIIQLAVGVWIIRAKGFQQNQRYRNGWKGVYTRAFAENVFSKLTSLMERKKETLGITVVAIVDFQSYIEKFGYKRAEYIMETTGQLLNVVSRKGDVVAVLEEGKFLVILPNTDHANSQKYVERVLGQINTLSVKVNLSFGTGICPEDSRDFNELVRYASKKNKSNSLANFN